MNSIAKLDSLDLKPEVSASLSHMMSRIILGNNNVIEGPMAKVPDIETKFKTWYSNQRSLNTLPTVLEEVEISNQDKFGPRSIALPWEERVKGVQAYFETKSTSLDKLSLPQHSARLRNMSLGNASQYLKKSTNAGLPFLKKKGVILDEALGSYNQLLNREDPCVLFTRTQEGGKTRPIWGYPIANTLQEMMFYRPLLEFQKSQSYRAAVVGPEEVDRGVTRLMKYASDNNLKLLSIDFSAYDTSISPDLIRLCYKYIKSMYQTSLHSELDYICERFINIGLCTPDGILTGEHGVPSGSTFTNEIDSLVQYIIAVNYPGEELKHFQIQGDDGLYAVSDPEGLMDWFRSFGLTVNEDKSLISTGTAQYLQLNYCEEYLNEGEYKGIYPVSRAFNRICYPERFTDFSRDDIDGEAYFAIRTISILENCKYHPYFKDFVKFIMSNDRVKLNVSEQSITDYIKLRDRLDGRDINFNIYQYGDYAAGIRNFASYKLIKELL